MSSDQVTQAMLMAAGLGTRLKPFTDFEPKALFPLMGVPIAQFAVDSMVGSGVSRIVANVHYHAEKTRAGIQALERGETELIISDESDLLLGSAGGIRKALPHFGGKPFFLINADVLCDIDLKALADRHLMLRRQWGVKMTLAIFERSPENGKYREIHLDRASGLVSGFGDLTCGKPFFIGSAVIEPEALAHVPSEGPAEFVPTILEPAIREKKVGFYLTDGTWKDVGSPSLWLDAHLHLIRSLENGKIAPRWRERLERLNRRVASEVWVSKDAPRRLHSMEWAGPAYWSPRSISGVAAEPPHALGPEAVLYGAGSGSGVELSRGIGSGGIWFGTSTF